ncbi:hypothetical protein J3R75_003644 [Oligosphaera ethanolica]|uniref:Uncharacterized protein n=1 Tax=Oligosphaera ethanolica TaxID=760260 RepID=A0AAE4ARI1_9BACT|nr:hypothetical protein [Oligosphaera ethanolica]
MKNAINTMTNCALALDLLLVFGRTGDH